MTTIFTFSNGVAIAADSYNEALEILTESLADYEGFDEDQKDDPKIDPKELKAEKQEVCDFQDLDEKFYVICQDPESTESNHEHMLETYGDDLIKAKLTHPNHIWTILEGDNNLTYVCPGFHFVNRMGYLQTLKPWTDENQVFLW